jgi:hypothetical protein
MWPIVFGFSFGFICLWFGLYFLVWAAREHHFANQYRAGQTAPQQRGWSVVYKDKTGAQQTMFIPGAMDESAMLKKFFKLRVPLNCIMSSTRIGF